MGKLFFTKGESEMELNIKIIIFLLLGFLTMSCTQTVRQEDYLILEREYETLQKDLEDIERKVTEEKVRINMLNDEIIRIKNEYGAISLKKKIDDCIVFFNDWEGWEEYTRVDIYMFYDELRWRVSDIREYSQSLL